jgi:adenylate cyclase
MACCIRADLMSWIIFQLIFLALYVFLRFRDRRKLNLLEQLVEKKTEELIAEKQKREALLGKVLPKSAANEIMVKGKADKIKYNFVTVLFSDIQGFTRIAEEMNPELLIDELDKFFFYFDSVVEKFGIEKIKTIGDAYMCAGGIPEKNRTNPVEVVLAALEMQAYMLRLKQGSDLEGMKFWDIRIGIHTGTVVAGVIGQKKLSYDIWGDTVNTASRMESSGEAGKINISGTTYEFIGIFLTVNTAVKCPSNTRVSLKCIL